MKRKMSRKNKKAMFFTLMAISILTLFLISETFYFIVKDRKSINKRVETMNNFVFSVEQDLSRQLYIAGFRSIFLFEKRIIDTGSYITDIDSAFEEAFFNGELDGEEQELMNGAKFSDIQESLNEKAAKINTEISLTNPSLTVEQEDPWQVKFTLTANLLMKDKANLALWNKTSVSVAYVPIENFEDPIYIVNTNGLVTNKINKTVYMPFVQNDDVSNLSLHIKNFFYIASASAPSFLDRLKGEIVASENGIESLVYLPRLSAQEISVKEKSSVDYIYFSSSNPSSYQIEGLPSWFELDEAHLDVYGVSHLKI